MKKVFLCFIVFVFLSCSTDDETSVITNENAIRFTLNDVDYIVNSYEVVLNPANIEDRIIEATFDNNTKTLLFSVLVEETNQIDEFMFIANDTYYTSDPIYGDRETSITTHTATKMEGTFRVTLKDANDEPVFTFTNGKIDIEF